jgi:anthraniloyl-CoA monooxygenase
MYQTPFADRICNEVGIQDNVAVGNIYEADHVNSTSHRDGRIYAAIARRIWQIPYDAARRRRNWLHRH